MSRKNNSVQPYSPKSSESLDHWMHAVAFVIVRRQMRKKWKSDIRVSISA
jgi:hypothetical protein